MSVKLYADLSLASVAHLQPRDTFVVAGETGEQLAEAVKRESAAAVAGLERSYFNAAHLLHFCASQSAGNELCQAMSVRLHPGQCMHNRERSLRGAAGTLAIATPCCDYRRMSNLLQHESFI